MAQLATTKKGIRRPGIRTKVICSNSHLPTSEFLFEGVEGILNSIGFSHGRFSEMCTMPVNVFFQLFLSLRGPLYHTGRFTILLKELSRILFRYPLFYRGKIFGVTKSHFYVKCRERKLVKSLVKEDFRVFFTIFFLLCTYFVFIPQS